MLTAATNVLGRKMACNGNVNRNSESLSLRCVVSPRFSRQFGLAGNAVVLFVALLLLGSLATIAADPGAASFALGGLQFRKEPRVSMVRQSLRFDDESEESDIPSLEFKVTAEYEFLNNTNQAVTIPIAFPLPDDVCNTLVSPYSNFAATAFHVWVEGQEIKYATEARAFRSDEYLPTYTTNAGKEYTALLREFGIAPEACKVNDSVSQARRTKLVTLGLFDRDTNAAIWTVRRKYYWTQTFPAGKRTRIKVEYPAQMGYSDVYLGKGWDNGLVRATDELWRAELSHTCGSAGLQKKVAAEVSQPEGFVKVYWLDFILVTANYWNGPIKDFVLTVNTSNPHVSFCWDGPVKRPDATHVVATAHDFSPKQDLHIGFLQVF